MDEGQIALCGESELMLVGEVFKRKISVFLGESKLMSIGEVEVEEGRISHGSEGKVGKHLEGWREGEGA